MAAARLVLGPITTVILGTIKPGDNAGNSTGTLNTHSLVFAPTSATTVAELQVMGSGGVLNSDRINITGDLTLNSSSNFFINGNGCSATVGDSFTLLAWTGLLNNSGFNVGSNLRTGSNADGNEGNLDLPDITGRGVWDISLGTNSLIITVDAIVPAPEPSRAMLLAAGLMTMVLRRRRSK
jgi:fibronectin-binding autotransporter adhesin